jgi:hypothetical protein
MNHRYTGIAAGVLALSIACGSLDAQPAPVRVPASVLQRYVGEYDQNGTTVRVSISGDTLFREVPGQRVALVPITETLFRMGPVFTTEFVNDPAGGMTQFVTDGAMVEFRLPRKGSRGAPLPVSQAANVRVPRSILERYAGTYEFLPGQMGRSDLRVVIRLKGERLSQLVNGEDVVLTPSSEREFSLGNTRLKLEFVVDDAGVTLVMGSGFQQLLARLTSKD